MKKILLLLTIVCLSAFAVGLFGCGHTHAFTDSVVAPTYTEQGYTLHTCECGYSFKDNFTEYDFQSDYDLYVQDNVYYSGDLAEWKSDLLADNLSITVTVNTNAEGEEYTLNLNKGQTLPAGNEIVGHNFIGWYTDDTLAQPVSDIGFMVNTELFANYEKKTYIVNYYLDAELLKTVSFFYKDNIAFPDDESPLGYKVTEWLTADGAPIESEHVTDNLDLYAETVFDFLEIPAVMIDTENGAEIVSKEEYVSAKVSIMNTAEEFELDSIDAGIRGRGNTSWLEPKKSYRIKFDKKQSLFGSEYKAKSWTLIANYCDKTLSRNALAYDLSEEFDDITFSSARHYVDVYLNGEYLGVYLLCDQIQTGDGRVEIEEKLIEPENTGYFLESDFRAPQEGVEEQDWFGCLGCRYTIKTPDTKAETYLVNTEAYIEYIRE